VRRVLLSCLAAGVLGLAVPNAHAADPSYLGRCGFATTQDNRAGGALGGRSVRTGEVHLYVVPVASGVPAGGAVTAWCELRVNGVSRGTVLGPVSGTGAVVAAGPLQFRTPWSDIVTICTHVVTAAGTEVYCPDAAPTEVVPQPVYDAIELLGLSPAPVADTAACAALGGDTTYDGYWLYDCPPAA
jgi:hypothetical protein